MVDWGTVPRSGVSRLVTLALVGLDGEYLGALPPYGVEMPWWSEVESVVAGARVHHHADVTVLRLLHAEVGDGGESGRGGRVEYLAELHSPAPDALIREERTFADDPRRLPWAQPGGPAVDLAWAEQVLQDAGRWCTGPAVQIRTWNLSSIWRLPATQGDVWLKVVPPLLGHEGAVLDALSREGAPVPRLVGFDGHGRVLLEDMPGQNQWAPDRKRLTGMVLVLIDLQVSWIDRLGELLTLGAHDWRRTAFIPAVNETVASWSLRLPSAISSALQRVVDRLEERFAALESCGVPDTLLHGDFHPGNFRSDGTSLTLLDWGDCGVGHPLLDMVALLGRIDARHHELIVQTWLSAWSNVLPGSEPDRAYDLVRPLAALRNAVTYHRFLEAFEPSERPYHESDVPHWLCVAAETGR